MERKNNRIKRFILIIGFLFIVQNIYAMTFKEYINTPIRPKELTKKELRLAWENALGWDAFSIYFTLKDMEKDLIEHTQIRIHHLKGGLVIDEHKKQVLYIFKIKF